MDESLKNQLRDLLKTTALTVDRQSFWQEPHFTSAFFGKLHGVKLSNDAGQYIRLMFSASNDRGPGSAEHATGVDVGLVFQWMDPNGENFEKAVLLQAKNHLKNLNKTERGELEAQCSKMAAITSSFAVMDCPYDSTIPKVYESKRSAPYWTPPPISLDEYLIDYVLECKRGDVADRVIEIARRADRCLIVKTNSPKPKPDTKTRVKPVKKRGP